MDDQLKQSVEESKNKLRAEIDDILQESPVRDEEDRNEAKFTEIRKAVGGEALRIIAEHDLVGRDLDVDEEALTYIDEEFIKPMSDYGINEATKIVTS